jgi:hypothetical protein
VAKCSLYLHLHLLRISSDTRYGTQADGFVVTDDALPYNAGPCEYASLRVADAADIGIGGPLVEFLEACDYVYGTPNSFRR